MNDGGKVLTGRHLEDRFSPRFETGFRADPNCWVVGGAKTEKISLLP